MTLSVPSEALLSFSGAVDIVSIILFCGAFSENDCVRSSEPAAIAGAGPRRSEKRQTWERARQP